MLIILTSSLWVRRMRWDTPSPMRRGRGNGQMSQHGIDIIQETKSQMRRIGEELPCDNISRVRSEVGHGCAGCRSSN